jgi:RNA polymerase subunit RPABC4/transcription elongation factor Spt4
VFGLFKRYDDAKFICPCCGSEEYSRSKWENLMNLLLVLNPGLAVGELLLGGRSPVRIYLCKRCPQSSMDNQYVYCPGCGRFHDGMIWAKNHGFWHWLGLICPDCGSRIPCLLNLTSWFILSKLSPLSWLLWRLFGKRYQAYEQRRARRAQAELAKTRKWYGEP